MKKFWIVVAISCNECNSKAVALFDHNPTKQEISAIGDKIGRMNCINIYINEIEVNKEIQELE